MFEKYLLCNECHFCCRFIEITLERLESWRASEMKILVLRCILEMLQLDSDGSQLSQVG